MLKNGLEVCTCKKNKCERFGKCNECIAYHETNKHHALPQCMRKNRKTEDKKDRK